MIWNFHSYYTNRDTGLIGQLLLSDSEKESLKALRQIVRERIRDVFTEAKQLVRLSNNHFSVTSFRKEFINTKFDYLKLDDQQILAELIIELSDVLKAEFMKLNPRFWTQGSFMYDTLNRPYKTPPQEMDIDDGTYLPMMFFEDKPAIGHQLLLLLVDASLSSLAAERSGWSFEAKETCGRIKISGRNVHIDVPMYAIPYEKFLEKEVLLEKAANSRFSMEVYDSISIADHALYDQLDANCVNLAVRRNNQKWIKSDPKDVHLWFQDSCQRTGQHLRKICRILKAWRDAQWVHGGGPSSISLMAAIVEIVNSTVLDPKDFGLIMLTVARKLPNAFRNGIESPDDNDERPLFPPIREHEDKHTEVITKLEQLVKSLESAYKVQIKQDALSILNAEFGSRVTNIDLIFSQAAAPAYGSPPLKAKEAAIISTSMKSG